MEDFRGSMGPVDAICEECGVNTKYPSHTRGTVQTCPQCFAYVDVPGGQNDFEDWDVGEPEE